MPARAERPLGPAALDGAYRREAERLLRALAEESASAFREGDGIRLQRQRRGVALPGPLFAFGAMALLVETGAAASEARAGAVRFRITEAGRARLRRSEGGENPFGDQHRDLATRADPDLPGAAPLTVNRKEDPLERLKRHRGRDGEIFAGPAALAAGERLRADLDAGQSLPRVTSDWGRLVVDGAGPGRGPTLSERALAARQRVDRALRAAGPDFAGMLVDVCGFGRGIGEIEKARGWPVRSGKLALVFALNALARHYGFADTAEGAPSAGIRVWADEPAERGRKTG